MTDTRPIWYDLDGQPCSTERAGELMCGKERIVAKSTVGDAEVSTVNLLINHRFFGDGPPILWETMIFGNVGDVHNEYQRRYASLAAARAGHEQIVAHLRACPGDTCEWDA